MSAGEFFPYWHRHYGAQFGHGHLYVATFRGDADFSRFPLGRLVRLDAPYSDPLRAALISDWVRELLTRYDVVIRADVDEFLAPHPRRAASLAAYVQTLQQPYVTALGLDVIETSGEPPLALDGRKLLPQRRFCVATTSLCKIAVVTRPTKWSVGFHFADAAPILDDLLLFHFKFADVRRRAAWFGEMLERCDPGSTEREYYSDALAKLTASLDVLNRLPRRAGWAAFDDSAFSTRFLNSVEAPAHGGLFTFPFAIDRFAREIPSALAYAL
jgi:hypothetical protein